MNESTSAGRRQRRSRLRRACVLAAAAAGIALLAAACGGSSSMNAPTSGIRNQLQKALAYSHCMRSHGFPNFPDPTEGNGTSHSGGGVTYAGVQIRVPDGIDPNSPAYMSANNTCTKQTGFGHVSAAQLRQMLTALLKYSECMRSHGVPDFPDPIETSTGVSLKTGNIDQNTSQYKAADKACRALQPGAGS